MRDELTHIIDQIERSYRGDAWHGPSVGEVLQGVDAAQAQFRLTPGGHSIWELALHLRATVDILLGRIAGTVGAVEDEAYWPAVPAPSEEAWRKALAELGERHDTLIAALTQFDPARLDGPLFAGGSTAINNFLGHAQHNAYHGGQIALMKKALRSHA